MLRPFYRVSFGAAFGGRPYLSPIIEDEPERQRGDSKIGTKAPPDGGLLGTPILG